MASYQVAGLFAGIGGIELGLHRAGHRTELLCECWEPAASVLQHRFSGVPVHPDVTTLRSLPRAVDMVTAGFPCQDLSQAGLAAGISGSQSGLVGEVFRLLRRRHPTWLLLENVQFMLHLDRGRAMAYLVDSLGEMGYRWAYRVVDSRFAGVPQRRRRVLLLASRREDPRQVLMADDAGPRSDTAYRDDAFGFYWTEGLRGLGWAKDATPTLKGGSTVGIPSAPGVWLPEAPPGWKLVMPSVEDAERLQGFPRGWTGPADTGSRNGPRWKLVGNAVTVGVARWVGDRLGSPAAPLGDSVRLEPGDPWPTAAWGDRTGTWRVDLSEYPRLEPYEHLRDVLMESEDMVPITNRGAVGFHGRALRGNLRFDPSFLHDVSAHIEFTSGAARAIPA